MRTRLWTWLLELSESDFDEEIFAWIVAVGVIILACAGLMRLGQEVATLVLG